APAGRVSRRAVGAHEATLPGVGLLLHAPARASRAVWAPLHERRRKRRTTSAIGRLGESREVAREAAEGADLARLEALGQEREDAARREARQGCALEPRVQELAPRERVRDPFANGDRGRTDDSGARPGEVLPPAALRLLTTRSEELPRARDDRGIGRRQG